MTGAPLSYIRHGEPIRQAYSPAPALLRQVNDVEPRVVDADTAIEEVVIDPQVELVEHEPAIGGLGDLTLPPKVTQISQSKVWQHGAPKM